MSLSKDDTLQNQGSLYVACSGLCVLVAVIASATLLYALGINSYGAALVFVLIIGVGFLVSNTTSIAINPNRCCTV